MENNYKIYQVSAFFTIKFNYQNIIIKEYKNDNEVFLFNKDNPYFKLIHISLHSQIDKGINLEELKKSLEDQFEIDKINYLDIHICNEEVRPENIYTICINENYYSGIDYSKVFPGLKDAVLSVKNEDKERKSLIKRINKHSIKFGFKKFYNKALDSKVTSIVGAICVVIYVFSLFLKLTGASSEAIYIVLGGNYKTFTYGLSQFYRFITNGFVHGGFMHLFFNLFSLMVLGPLIEKKYGSLKYSIILFGSIICGSLCEGCLSSNSLCLGLSGGLYGLMVVYILSIFEFNKGRLSPSIIYLIFINLLINFMPNVAWQTHLGGAIFGVVSYYMFKDYKINYLYLIVSILLICVLGIKYVSNDSIEPLYIGTDSDVLRIYDKLGLRNKYNKTKEKLIEIYIKEGAIYYE